MCSDGSDPTLKPDNCRVTPGVGPVFALPIPRCRMGLSFDRGATCRNRLIRDDFPVFGSPTTIMSWLTALDSCFNHPRHPSSSFRTEAASCAHVKNTRCLFNPSKCRRIFFCSWTSARSDLLSTSTRRLLVSSVSSSGLAAEKGTRASRTSITRSTAFSCRCISFSALCMCPGNQLIRPAIAAVVWVVTVSRSPLGGTQV
mmetsp:Transcript_26882/g.68986  ORF Transcript_26882/g.68986 Transcript_26882/m.68986 type:complete len:200 (+) Transcript_26882:716-1315(+)